MHAVRDHNTETVTLARTIKQKLEESLTAFPEKPSGFEFLPFF